MRTHPSFLSRRRFLSILGRSVVVGSLAGLDVSRFAHAAGSGVIRLGLIGCGGRGSGAAVQALKTGKDVRLVAMADLFDERMTQSLSAMRKPAIAGQIVVPVERRFTGFNAFQELLASGVDGVLLTTPPAFRPLHFEAAVSAGMHCFLEKPVAVDAPGVRQIRAAASAAAQRGLSAIVGLQEHFDNAHRECLAEISHGTLGKLRRLQGVIHLGDVPRYARRGALERQLGQSATELEFQLRNWYPFVWLSGDMIVEMLVHHIHTCLRAAGQPPQRARGVAQRREHTTCESGDLSDFLSATYAYPDGSELQAEIGALANSPRQYQAVIEGERGPPRCGLNTPGLLTGKASSFGVSPALRTTLTRRK